MIRRTRQADDLVNELAAAADPAVAAVLARYFQVRPGGYGEGDIFFGLRLGAIRSLTRRYREVPFAAGDWIGLLRSPVHEHRMAALIVMGERAARGADHERDQIYRTYLANTAHIDNWDLVDVSCGPVVGGWLLDRDRAPLYDLVRSPLLWDRRIAMVSTQHFIRAGQSRDTYALATLLLDDPHDLMHKAVGWMLREAGKRVDPAELRRYLDEYASRLPRTALRYAIERFDADERRHYLASR